MRTRFLVLVLTLCGLACVQQSPRINTEYQIGVYYFGNYHVDPRNEAQHGKGWTEWEIVKRAEPRFPGHQQPKVPLWGYEDEADPKVMEKKIAAAADHGITHFIFDWYYYDDGPFLERSHDIGFMQARNNNRIKFALMWANCDWVDIHPYKLHTEPPLQYQGPVTRATFDHIVDLVISRYFKHPSYWTIDGAPYFSMYDISAFIKGLGGVEQAAEAFRYFREKTKAAGFPDLNLNGVFWGNITLPDGRAVPDRAALARQLGFDSITSYVWIHHVPLKDFPETDYRWVMQESIQYWHAAAAEFTVPFHPNVSMGWDSSPRTVQSDKFMVARYPFTPVLKGNTPQAFQEALVEVKKYLDNSKTKSKIFNINSWNEWTEGSYLEPDTINKMAYLEAIRNVFGRSSK